MNNLEQKFLEYFTVPRGLDVIKFAKDLAAIAEQDYEEKLIAADHNVHKMPHKFKHFELFGQEIQDLQKAKNELQIENGELKRSAQIRLWHIEQLEQRIKISRNNIIEVLNKFFNTTTAEQIAAEILRGVI